MYRNNMLFKKKIPKAIYDKENYKPVIKSSICTGEQVAGFKDLRTGKFVEEMLIRNRSDKQTFMSKNDITEEEITKEW